VLVSEEGMSNAFSPGELIELLGRNEQGALWKKRSVSLRYLWSLTNINYIKDY